MDTTYSAHSNAYYTHGTPAERWERAQQPGGHDIPSAISLLADRQGHDLSTGLGVQGRKSAHLLAATRHQVCRMQSR